MKRLLIVALATCFMLAMGTGLAFADSYDVTADFGKRVTEQGTCEETGSVSIQPATGSDLFVADQVITMELLGGLTVCNTFYAVYDLVAGGPHTYDATASTNPDPPGADQYSVEGTLGDDFVTITLGTSLTAGLDDETLDFGHDTYSRLCVNLSGTLYTASDPVYQLLQASYSDSLSNTFSGDQYIATVKSRTVAFSPCNKTEGDDINTEGYSSSLWTTKQSLPEIELCFTGTSVAQDQTTTDCGDEGYYGYNEICFEVADTATGAFQSGSTYQFTIGKTTGAKACVGIATATVYYGTSAQATTITERRASNNTLITPATSGLLADHVATSQITVTFTAQGPGSYFVKLRMAWNTCCATPGDYVIDFAGQRVPCGGSFSFTDQTVAVFVACPGTVVPSYITQYNAVCPYGAETATSGWFNGVVVTNPNSTSIDVVFTIYEADGDMYTGSVTVPANGQVVGFDTDVMSPVAGGTDATFGDESYAVYASSQDGMFYIFFLNFDGTQAQGYLSINSSMSVLAP
jgi:RNA polymerase subunit RPABC4/transcription elongation factor Spt4